MIEKEILNDTDVLYNYFQNNNSVGYLEIRIVDEIIDIMNLFVNEECRGNGIATKLLQNMLDNEKYNRVMLEVNEKNKNAIRLYNKLGFKEISSRVKYYGNDDAIIMELINYER